MARRSRTRAIKLPKMKPLTRFRSLPQALKEARQQGYATEWVARREGWLDLETRKKLEPDMVECIGYFAFGDKEAKLQGHLFLLEAVSGQKGFAAEVSGVTYRPAPSHLLAADTD